MGNKIVTCPICKGKGVLFDHLFGIFTCGLGYLSQLSNINERDECGRCKGTGFILVKANDKEE